MPAASDGLVRRRSNETYERHFTTGSADIRLSLHDGVLRLAPLSIVIRPAQATMADAPLTGRK
jgi:hypothetical protein